MRSTRVPGALLHDTAACATNDYFRQEHHLFQKPRLFYILSTLASCLWTGLSPERLQLILVPSACCRLWCKRSVPARSSTRRLALPQESKPGRAAPGSIEHASSLL